MILITCNSTSKVNRGWANFKKSFNGHLSRTVNADTRESKMNFLSMEKSFPKKWQDLFMAKKKLFFLSRLFSNAISIFRTLMIIINWTPIQEAWNIINWNRITRNSHVRLWVQGIIFSTIITYRKLGNWSQTR